MPPEFKNDIDRWRSNLAAERDALALYLSLAQVEQDATRREIWRELAAAEQRHADRWIDKLRAEGQVVRDDWRPGWRPRTLGLIARLFGPRAVLPVLSSLEAGDADMYVGQADAQDLVKEEEHLGRVVAAMAEGKPADAILREADRSTDGGALDGDVMAHGAGAQAEVLTPPVGAAPVGAGAHTHASAQHGTPPSSEDAAQPEGWHGGAAANNGALRAAIFGINDGLVSNFSLVMGVAGASAGNQFVLLAGVAGLLAGASSMAAGEYISMQSQRELFERQIALERDELEENPEEEQHELALIYRAKGVPKADAERLARHLMRDKDVALDTLVREELGLDPDELGSPWKAAASSFTAFAFGALVPVLPYMLLGGIWAFVTSAILCAAALFGVGAGVSLLTGRGVLYSGARMVLIGGVAAAITYLVGAVIGVSLVG